MESTKQYCDRVMAGPPAGKPTRALNASFRAFDYPPGKCDPGRSFLMDDYLTSGRVARRQDPNVVDATWDVLQYQKDVELFQPKQGFSETKFHAGFMRRQGAQMPYLVARVRARPPRV